MRLTLEYEWACLGQVLIEEGRLRFPAADEIPGVYRFDLPDRAYIGETDRLKRRFQQYRTPGRSQSTSIRLNRLLVETLGSGVRTDVWIVAPMSARAAARRRIADASPIVEIGLSGLSSGRRLGGDGAAQLARRRPVRSSERSGDPQPPSTRPWADPTELTPRLPTTRQLPQWAGCQDQTGPQRLDMERGGSIAEGGLTTAQKHRAESWHNLLFM